MCREEMLRFACGHTEMGTLFFCPANQRKMRNHRASQVETRKYNAVCFACDIPNMKTSGGKDSRRVQLGVLAYQEKEKDKLEEKVKKSGDFMSISPRLMGVANRMEELKVAEGRKRVLEKREHLRRSRDTECHSLPVLVEITSRGEELKVFEDGTQGGRKTFATMEIKPREDGWI